MITSKVNKDSELGENAPKFTPIEEVGIRILRAYAQSKGITKIQRIENGSSTLIRFGIARSEELSRELKSHGYIEIPEDFISAFKDAQKKKLAEKPAIASQEPVEEKPTAVVEEIVEQSEPVTVAEETSQEQEQPATETQPAIKFEVKKEENILDILNLNSSEQAEVYAAVKAINVPLHQLIKDGLLMKARKVNTEAEKLASMTLEQRKQTTMAGAAIANLRLTTDAIVNWNHAQYDNNLRVYINASILRTLSGSNLNTIKDFLAGYRTNDEFIETAEEHNARYELTEGDNRKGRDEFGNRIKIADLIKNSYSSVEQVKTQVAVVKPETATVTSTSETSVVTVAVQATQPLDVKAIALLPPADFAKAVDGLPEGEVKRLCNAKMDELRKQNKGKGVHSLKKLITPFRKEFETLALNTHNAYQHAYGTPRTIKDGTLPVPGSILSDNETKVIAEPRHLALKYLGLNEQEQQEAKKVKSEN